MPAPVAWDANGDTIKVARTYNSTSMTYTVDTAGAVWPIVLDPSIVDSTLYSTVSGAWGRSSPVNENTYNSLRNAASGTYDNSLDTRVQLTNLNYSNIDLQRTMLSWFLNGATDATSIDSALLIFEVAAGIETSGYADTILWVEGNWTGSPDKTKWDNFTGFSSDSTTGAFNVVEYADRYVVGYRTGARRDTVYFNASGKASLLSKMQSADTLEIMALTHVDALDRPIQALTYRASGVLFYYAYNRNTFITQIFYTTGGGTGWSAKVNGILPSKVNGVAPIKILGIQ
jgi:hypothetical protein